MNDYELNGIFPTPVYIVKRDLDLDSTDEADLEYIIKEGMYRNFGNSISSDTYIFDTKFKNLKKYCEQHIKVYVEEIINAFMQKF